MKKRILIAAVFVVLIVVTVVILVRKTESGIPGKGKINEDNLPRDNVSRKHIPISDISEPLPFPRTFPKHLQKLDDMMKEGGQVMPPDYGMMSNCTEEDYPYIRALLTREELKDYNGYAIRALGFIGTEQAVDDLLSMLREEGSPYTKRTAAISGSILHALGFAAHSNDNAYNFLKQACDIEFWKERMENWKIPEDSNILRESAVALDISIQAIGFSGRDDAFDFIYSLAQNKEFDRLRTAIVSSVFYLDLIKEKGWYTWKNDIYPDYIELCGEWMKDNPEWQKWSIGGPLPLKKEGEQKGNIGKIAK